MCQPPSSGRVRRRACGLPYPASCRRSRPLRRAARLLFDRCATAPETRLLLAVSRAHPSRVQLGGCGDSPAHCPGSDGRCASTVTLPRTPPGRFGRATADYVDRPQAALGSRHRLGTTPGPAGDRPSPLRTPTGDPTPITRVKVRTRAKSTTGFSLSKPVPGFKSGYRFSGCRLTSLFNRALPCDAREYLYYL